MQFSTAMSTTGAGSVTNPANYQLLQGATDISGDISGITYGFNPSDGHFEATLALTSDLSDGSYKFTARQSLQNSTGVNMLAEFVRSFVVMPLVASGIAVSATEEIAFTGPVAGFTDADPGGVASDFTATIQWDSNPADTSPGTVVANGQGGFNVIGTHTYAEGGTYFITPITITDDDGANVTTNSFATVADAPLSATGVNVHSIEGVVINASVATFTDANPSAPLSDYSATIQWDSNPAHTSAGTITLVAGVLTVSGRNTYAEEGSYPISVAINDVDGNIAFATSTATVADVALIATGVNVSATEGLSFTGTVATFIDLDRQRPLE